MATLDEAVNRMGGDIDLAVYRERAREIKMARQDKSPDETKRTADTTAAVPGFVSEEQRALQAKDARAQALAVASDPVDVIHEL